MAIKYGELTVIHHEQTKLESLVCWITNKEYEKTKYIFLFEDGEICDSEKVVDFYFKFLDSFASPVPVYFEKTIKSPHLQIYFNKKLKNFNEVFANYSKYDSRMTIVSKYNCIYDSCRSFPLPDKFGLVRLKSTEQMPRYQFAYDSEEFTKEEVIYLIHHIIKI